MKHINFLIAVLTTLLLCSCEDVVQVNLKTDSPKLVIEASINWYKNTIGNRQSIKLTTTTNYYDNLIPVVSGATVYITNATNATFIFTEAQQTGEYICTNFIPKIDETYTLTILNGGQTYHATETMKSIAPISEIIQNNEGGFTGNNIEIKTYYTDPANETNYYLYKYSYSNQVTQNFYTDEDTFFQGNPFFSISQSDNLKVGDEVIVTHYGISKQYYNYMNVLVSIAGGNGGGPFQSPPATVRGNIINTTNKEDYPLGYFSLSEVDTKTYTIQ
ncbi:DUF4249 domain-containing protein [Flavobacterium sp. WC2421]|uniref:DUF4249 domain-containing protein n=1 Tax=Flavobacterium sp. WC2421 TaxID=3234138 RepID=UPI00346501AE